MDFESGPEHEAAREAAEHFCKETLPSLPGAPDDFFREAAQALQTSGLFDEDSIALAVRTAMAFGAASGSLGLVYAACQSYAWTLRRLAPAGTKSASGGAPHVGVIAFGEASSSRVSAGPSKIMGRAAFVAGGPIASRLLLVTAESARDAVLAVVDPETAGVVREPLGGPGFERIPKCAVLFDGAVVERYLDGSEQGVLRAWSAARVLAASVAVGVGRHAFDLARTHLRGIGHRPSQSVEFSLSDVATDLDAAELSISRAAWAIDRKMPHALESASAKLLAARAATRASHTALALTGNAGYTDELRECYLDACALESYLGSTAEHEGSIASKMLEES